MVQVCIRIVSWSLISNNGHLSLILLQWFKAAPWEQKGVVFNQDQMGWAFSGMREKAFFFFLQERESYPVTSYLDLDVLFGWTTHKPKHQHSFTKRQEKEKSRSESLLFLAFVLYFCAVSSRGFHAVRIPNEALTSAVRLEALSPFLSVHPPPPPPIPFLFFSLSL